MKKNNLKGASLMCQNVSPLAQPMTFQTRDDLTNQTRDEILSQMNLSPRITQDGYRVEAHYKIKKN